MAVIVRQKSGQQSTPIHTFYSISHFSLKHIVTNNWYFQVQTDTPRRQNTPRLRNPYIHTRDAPQDDLSNTQIPNIPLHTHIRAFQNPTTRTYTHTHTHTLALTNNRYHHQQPLKHQTHPHQYIPATYSMRIWGQRIEAYIALGPQVGPVVHQCPGDL